MTGLAIQALDFQSVRDEYPERWGRAKSADVDAERLDDEIWEVEFADGDEHECLLFDGETGAMGCCDCEHMQFNPEQGPCAHLCRIKMIAELGSLDLPDPPEEVRASVKSDDNPRGQAAETAGPTPQEAQNLVEHDIPDPLDVLPEYTTTDIQGEPALNKRGSTVLAYQFDVDLDVDVLTRASETDWEYAEVHARAVRTLDDGREVSAEAQGVAHADDGNSVNKYRLTELAETRAIERAVEWITGTGLAAYQIVQSSLSEYDNATQPAQADE